MPSVCCATRCARRTYGGPQYGVGRFRLRWRLFWKTAAWPRTSPTPTLATSCSASSPDRGPTKENGRCPLRSTGRWNPSTTAPEGRRRHSSERHAGDELQGARSSHTTDRPEARRPRLVAEVGDRRVGQAGEGRGGIRPRELRVVEHVERIDTELELQPLRAAEDLRH